MQIVNSSVHNIRIFISECESLSLSRPRQRSLSLIVSHTHVILCLQICAYTYVCARVHMCMCVYTCLSLYIFIANDYSLLPFWFNLSNNEFLCCGYLVCWSKEISRRNFALICQLFADIYMSQKAGGREITDLSRTWSCYMGFSSVNVKTYSLSLGHVRLGIRLDHC